METTNIKNTSFWDKIKVFIIDFTFIFYLFQIIRFIVSPFCYISFIPLFIITWLFYNIISLCVWQQTLGSGFFNARITNLGNKKTLQIRIVLMELFTSIPGILLIFFCFIHYLPIFLGEVSIVKIASQIIPYGLIAILIILSPINLLRTSIFKVNLITTITINSRNNLIHRRKLFLIVYSSILLFAGVSRYLHTHLTNDITKMESSWKKLPFKPDPNNNWLDSWNWIYYSTPRPTAQSIQEYTDFLKLNRQDINDYIFSLFEKYDHVILCERMHPEMTQYEMIYNLVTDIRFTENIGNIFTESGNVDSREAYDNLSNIKFPNDTVFEQTLSSFMMENQSFYLIWSNTNWFYFLKSITQFNHNKRKKIKLLFSDRANWIYNDKNYNRDSIMARNIISTIRKDTLNKSLIIMNYRHAYLKGKLNCGNFISKEFPGKVANVLINTKSGNTLPLQSGKWDVAFEQMPEDAFAFNMENSPFGNDKFDHYHSFSPLAKLRYEDMFTGFIYYKPLYLHYIGDGFPYMMQPNNIKILKERARILGESTNYICNAPNKVYFRGLKFQYFIINLIDNTFFAFILIIGMIILICLYIKYKKQSK